MPKSSPEKLAKALRANLQRRKQAKPAKPAAPPQDAPSRPPKNASPP